MSDKIGVLGEATTATAATTTVYTVLLQGSCILTVHC